jgi:hypothetical protein
MALIVGQVVVDEVTSFEAGAVPEDTPGETTSVK